MVFKKRRLYSKRNFLLIFIIFSILALTLNISSLGLTPAKKEINFNPNLETTFNYKSLADENQEVYVYAEGDLAKYVSFSKNTLNGSEPFNVTIKFPESIETPGRHRIFIVAEEKIDEELAATIGTRIIVKGVIYIDIPYPGKYLEILSFSSGDANVGEPVKFELSLANRGTEDLTVEPVINIFSDDKKIESLSFKERIIKSQETLDLKKMLDTADYKAGKYTASLVVDYGDVLKNDIEFKIGNFSVEIVNYTEKISIGGIRKFDIGIKSNWNNKIDFVHAEISIFNDSGNFFDFKTFPVSLGPWESKNLEGYIEVNNFSKGTYDMGIILYYYGNEVKSSTVRLVKVKFFEEKDYTLLILIISGIIIFIIVVFLIFYVRKRFFIKHGKKTKR